MRRRRELIPRRPPRGQAGGRPAPAPGALKGRLSLARALSKFGVCSRKEAIRLIGAGRVAVDGRVNDWPALRIDPRRSRVTVDGMQVGDDARRTTLVLHKPVGYITSRTDPRSRATVYDLLRGLQSWVFPVGRLDRDSAGLLVLTNDHQLGHHLTSPEPTSPRPTTSASTGPEPRSARRSSRGARPRRWRRDTTRPGASSRHRAGWSEQLARDHPHGGEEPPGAPNVCRHRPRRPEPGAGGHRQARARRAPARPLAAALCPGHRRPMRRAPWASSAGTLLTGGSKLTPTPDTEIAAAVDGLGRVSSRHGVTCIATPSSETGRSAPDSSSPIAYPGGTGGPPPRREDRSRGNPPRVSPAARRGAARRSRRASDRRDWTFRTGASFPA